MKQPGQFQFAAFALGPDTHHPVGTVVSRPSHHMRCWAVVALNHGQSIPKPYGCRVRHRHGQLCCHNHKKHEQAARELRDSEAKQAAHDQDVRTLGEEK